MPSPDERSLLTTRQVASRLNCDRRTVARLVASGRLPAARVGRDYRFDPRVIDAFALPPAVS